MKMWIEMSRDEEHGGNEWGFTKCIWAPTYKNNEESKTWPFWENVNKVKTGDIVFILEGKGKRQNLWDSQLPSLMDIRHQNVRKILEVGHIVKVSIEPF